MEKAEPMTYTIKTIFFMKRRVPIMMQNQNGPCPLLALANILLLRNQIQLSPDAPSISQDRLISLVAGFLLDSNSSGRLESMDEDYRANTQQNIADAIAQLPKLATGIDVNVGFTNVRAFEFTQETVIFDLLDVRLLHGWLVDPQDGELASTVAQHSYNELVSLLVDRLGDEAALQSKPGSRPHTPTPETAAKEELPPGNAMVESEKHGELVQPSSASRVGQAEKQSIGQEETGPMSKAAEQEAPVHAMQGLKLGDDEELADLEKAIALSLADNSLTNQAEGSSSTPNVPLDQGSGSEASQTPQPSMQDRQPIAVAATSSEAQPLSHETAPSDSVAIPADGSAHESETAIEDGKSGGQAGDAVTGASNVHAERTTDSPQKATALPEHSEVGPSSSHAETAAPLPAEPQVEEPSSSGAYQEEEIISKQQGAPQERHVYDAAALAKGKMPARHVPLSECTQPEDERWPQEADVQAEALKECHGYDQSEKRAEELHQAMLVQAFFNRTSSQLTEHGLLKLHEGMRKNELGILFRNNHFNVIFCHNEAVWVLATDQGYLFEEVVWEKLRDVHGNNEFARADFTCLNDRNESQAVESTGLATGSADADLALALQMQEEENERQARFLAEQDSQHQSYSQVAAKQAKDTQPPREGGAPSPKGAATSRIKKGKPAGEKWDAWKFWK